MEGGREWHLGNLVAPDYDRVMAELAEPAEDSKGIAATL